MSCELDEACAKAGAIYDPKVLEAVRVIAIEAITKTLEHSKIADLRAYKNKTEAALAKWSDTMQFVFAERMGRDVAETRSQALGIKLAMDHAKELGLWPKEGS